MPENDALSTLSLNLLHTIAERSLSPEYSASRYKPSYVARVINRSIASGNIDKDPNENLARRVVGRLPKRGHFSDIDPTTGIVPNASDGFVSLVSSDGYKVTYEGVAYPGYKYGKNILEEHLDLKVTSLMNQGLNETQSLRLAAMIAGMITAIHPFPDGNGRTSIGTASIYLEILTGQGIDLEKLMDRNKDLIADLALISYCLLPKSYSAEGVNDKLRRMGKEKSATVSLPPMGNIKEFKDFFKDYAHTISKAIDKFDVNLTGEESNLTMTEIDFYKVINSLATLFGECRENVSQIVKPVKVPER